MKIFVDCVHCGEEFDILTAKSCQHGTPTCVCPHCEKCACGKDLTGYVGVKLNPPIRGIDYLIVKREMVIA